MHLVPGRRDTTTVAGARTATAACLRDMPPNPGTRCFHTHDTQPTYKVRGVPRWDTTARYEMPARPRTGVPATDPW